MVDLGSLKKLKEQQKTSEESKKVEQVEKPVAKKIRRVPIAETTEQVEIPETLTTNPVIQPAAKVTKIKQTKPRARRPKVQEPSTIEVQEKTNDGYVPGIEEWHMVYKLITGQTIRAPGDQIKKAVMETLNETPLPNPRHRGYHRSFDR
jgi:hypothetical protein